MKMIPLLFLLFIPAWGDVSPDESDSVISDKMRLNIVSAQRDVLAFDKMAAEQHQRLSDNLNQQIQEAAKACDGVGKRIDAEAMAHNIFKCTPLSGKSEEIKKQ